MSYESATQPTRSPNGLHPKRAILYARVSTKGQAEDDAYSLPQQLAALRDYCDREGFEVTEEITDPGYSGASLQRPGLDRVRDLVERGGVSVVLAQDRDRFARLPAYLFILREEFAAHGTALRALNDRGDDSPEGQLADGVLDELARYERAKFAERSRRGLSQKVRSGLPVVTGKPPFGYRLAENGRLEVDEPEMGMVRRIFREAADGQSLYAIQKTLNAQCIPTPTGRAKWSKGTLRYLINSDVYVPHDFAEVSARVSAEVAATLEKDRTYGLWGFNKRRTKTWHEPDGSGRYRRRSQHKQRPPDQWLYAPVPDCGLPRSVVETARQNVKSRARKPSGAAKGFWELSGGIARCAECGSVLSPHVSVSGDGRRTHYYYTCRSRYNDTNKDCQNRHSNRAEELEALVWDAVHAQGAKERLTSLISSAYLQGSEPYLTQLKDDLSKRALMSERLEKLEARRSTLIDLGADGIIGRDDLREKLAAFDEERHTIRQELGTSDEAREVLLRLVARRDYLVMASKKGRFEHIFAANDPEERHATYKKMGLTVEVDGEGNVTLKGALVPEEAFVGKDSGRPPTSRKA